MRTARLPSRVLAPLALFLATAAASLPACRSGNDLVDGPVYPDLPQTRVLDIQVRRVDTQIHFTNTTAETIPASRLWLNRWWHLDIDPVEIGESVTLDLGRFVDPYGEPYRAGGFFATERPDKVVQAQFEYAGTLVGAVVINQ